MRKSSLKASLSGCWLPFSAVGVSNFGVVRSIFLTILGFSLAHLEASVRVSPSQTLQALVEGKQQRQQQWTSGDGDLVTVVCATVDNSSDVSSDVGIFCRVLVASPSVVVVISVVVVSGFVVVFVVVVVVVVSAAVVVNSVVVATSPVVTLCIRELDTSDVNS